ncbi:MAG TPA: universal stress protein [Myxococcota bacterium]|nr:universal stress protein [Myxococcota bacterium]
MKIQRILVPTDFSSHADLAVKAAASLAKSFGASLKLLHVVQLPAMAVNPDGPVMPVTFYQELRSNAQKRLVPIQKRLEASGLRVESEVTEDAPGFAIAAVAEQTRADLIVMGSRGLTGLKHVLLGSVAERTVRSAPCPVLTVKSGELALRTIVVPMDFSPAAHEALEIAKSLAKTAGPTHLVLAHAYYVPVELEQYLVSHGDPFYDRLAKGVTKDLEAILLGLSDAGISAEYVARPGVPEAVILELAKEKKADLVAMGTHGRRGLKHLLLGSVAESVVRGADCAVLTVRERPAS